jgi:hypothetical protein
MFWERESPTRRREMLFEIQKMLCSHHRDHVGPQVHPENDFFAPEWPEAFVAAPFAVTGAVVPEHAESCAQ